MPTRSKRTSATRTKPATRTSRLPEPPAGREILRERGLLARTHRRGRVEVLTLELPGLSAEQRTRAEAAFAGFALALGIRLRGSVKARRELAAWLRSDAKPPRRGA